MAKFKVIDGSVIFGGEIVTSFEADLNQFQWMIDRKLVVVITDPVAAPVESEVQQGAASAAPKPEDLVVEPVAEPPAPPQPVHEPKKDYSRGNFKSRK